MTNKRLTLIQEFLDFLNIDCIYITNISNIRYLTGFTGSSGYLLITKEKGLFVTDFRYQEQSKAQVKGFDIFIESTNKRIDFFKDFIKVNSINTLTFERTITYDIYNSLLLNLPVTLHTLQYDIVPFIRRFKDEQEMADIKDAIRIAETAFLNVKPYIKAGVTELSIVKRLEDEMFNLGCRRPSFDIIVASGANSALPHAQATDKKINEGDFVIIDWGAVYNGYCSDLTRTLIVGKDKMQSWQKEIYDIVNTARQRAISSAKSKALVKDVDIAARDYIKSRGYGEHFGHSTGHGIGLQPHEEPRIACSEDDLLYNGMVITIEPGIYLPGKGGVRIEDMVMPFDECQKVLTTLSCQLEANLI